MKPAKAQSVFWVEPGVECNMQPWVGRETRAAGKGAGDERWLWGNGRSHIVRSLECAGRDSGLYSVGRREPPEVFV